MITCQPGRRSITVTGNSLVVKLSNNANGNLNADAIRIERVTTTSPPPVSPPPPAVQIVDDGDAGFGTTAGWTAWTSCQTAAMS